MSALTQLRGVLLVALAATSGCIDKQPGGDADAGSVLDAGKPEQDASMQDASMQDASDGADPVDAEADAFVDAGPPPPPTCPPEPVASICARLGADCASVTTIDVCGESRTVDCGTCPAGSACGAGAAPNVCATCAAESDADFCTRLGKNCGAVTAPDNCGTSRAVNCGTCAGADTCSPSNVCGCVAETDAAFCTRLGANCGSVNRPDNCGDARTAACGMCTSPETCGGSGSPYYCGVPAVCEPPSTTPSYTPAAVQAPPAPFAQGRCTLAQVSSLVAACFGDAASATACNAWQSSNTSCGSCVLTPSTAAALGPIVSYASDVDASQNPLGRRNDSVLRGVQACLEHHRSGCGVAFFNQELCLQATCDQVPACTTAALIATCRATASSGVCATAYANAFDAGFGVCRGFLSPVAPGSPVLVGDACVPLAGELDSSAGRDAFTARLLRTFCGP